MGWCARRRARTRGLRGGRFAGKGRSRLLIPAGAALLAVLTACTAAPAPPLVATSASPTSPVTPTDLQQIVVGVDGIGGGYNPHELSDQSSVTTALSTMLLPSAFRTAPDGTPQLDTNLMVSAQVTDATPFTVVYQLRTDANWSDGTPVDAADFVYLRNQMVSQPGVIDPVGYQLIDKIAARDNAKTITVTFTKPYPAWRTLFADLLPAHLLKDAPGGFANAMNTGFPASAGPFDIKTLDAGGGEIVLERNARYWGTPSVPDQVVLRKSDTTGAAEALRSNADQLSYNRVDSAGLAAFKQLGSAVKLSTVPRSETAVVLLRPSSPQLADKTVRAAIAAAINRGALIATGTGGGPSAQLPANGLVVAPSQAGYAATMPASAPGATPDPAKVPGLLAQAGFVQSGSTWTRAGKSLNIVIAAPADREPYDTIAAQLRAQLVGAGIPATVRTPTASQLYEQLLNPISTPSTTNASPIDIVVGPQPAGGDPTTQLASWFGCAPTLPGAPAPAQPVSSGPLDWCDSAVQSTIQSALTGETSQSAALAAVEPQLWAQAVEIPLFQLSDALVVGERVSGVDDGPPFAGPFFDAATWSRTSG